MKEEARRWFAEHSTDLWRIRCSIRTTRHVDKDDKLIEVYEDDLERFFPAKAWRVSSANIIRWRAAVEVARELERAST